MKFSLALPRPTEPSSIHPIDDAVAFAASAEAAGLHAVSASDHPFPVVRPGQAGHDAFDPFVLLATVGAGTKAIRLHFSLIVAPYRNPFVAARMLATLDTASRGRVIAALGAGYLAEEFAALGASFDERNAQVAESVEAMSAAWTGEPVTMTGRGWTADGNVMRPVPASMPRPPIWRGGNTATAIRHAVAACDGWAPFEVTAIGSEMTASKELSLTTLPSRLAVLREAREAAGRAAPFDVCYVRTSRRWLEDEARVNDELSRLDELGVTWLELTVPGQDVPVARDQIERFAALARAAGVLDSAARASG